MDGQAYKSITVLIAGRPYPLKIQEEEEEMIRAVVKQINEKINHFQLTYTIQDKQDCLAMAVLVYAMDMVKASKNIPDVEIDNHPKLNHKISVIEGLIDRILNNA